MLVIIELIGALVLIGVCALGVSKLIQSYFDRPTDRKDPE